MIVFCLVFWSALNRLAQPQPTPPPPYPAPLYNCVFIIAEGDHILVCSLAYSTLLREAGFV